MALGIKAHLAEVFSSADGAEFIANKFKAGDISALQGLDFSRLFDIQGANSEKMIPGAAALHVPFPTTEPITAAYLEWLQANITKLAPLFDDMGEGSIYQQTLAGVQAARTAAGKTDAAEYATQFEAAWKGGWLRNSVFVALLTHMTSTVARDAVIAAADGNLPKFDVLSLLIEKPSREIFAPFAATNEPINEGLGKLVDRVGDLSVWRAGLIMRAFQSEYLVNLIPLEDLPQFDESFRRLETATKIGYLLDYFSNNKEANSWTAEQVEAFVCYIEETVDAHPEKSAGNYQQIWEYFLTKQLAGKFNDAFLSKFLILFPSEKEIFVYVLNGFAAAYEEESTDEMAEMLRESFKHFFANQRAAGTYELMRVFLQEMYPESIFLQTLYPKGLENKFAATMPEVVAPARPASPASVFSMGEGARMSPAATDATADDRSTPGLDESDSDSRAGARPISMGIGYPSATKVVGVKLPVGASRDDDKSLLEQLADFSAKTGGVTTSDLGAIKEFATSLKDSLALNDGNYQKLVQALKKDEHAGLMPVLDSIREILANSKSLSVMMVIDTLRARVEDASYDATIKPKEGAKSTEGTFRTDMLFMKFEADSGAPAPAVPAVK